MKTITITQLRQQLSKYIEAAQKEVLVITRRGQPVAILVGVKNQAWETLEKAINSSSAKNRKPPCP